MMMRGIRGATTVEENSEKEILLSTHELLGEMIASNRIDPDKVASVFISATADITRAFPAKALREFDDWKYVPVMCMQELDVPGGLERCIRLMIHYNTGCPQKDIKHIYLKKAVSLRPDLSE
ncbi:chorismate mutase [[Bacillus] enclensis]|jgi:chorismate mutase|uniref:chorismate mutase n=2 Tax=Rossellomorea TaxID=2837508 RepID=A0A0V8HM19_9BACI|nr:chorismate mutase [[Bacillus] enclensis]QTC43322.1 chorismate mutase [Bacillus sp. V3]QWC21489.1 chorismate mutase [Bacillus haikouensis]KSU63466.1 chorismate mutase [[Bacillus] enclensis]MBH9967758.1 chorismate mutase [[Bacillus] enclensis]SCB84435.1 chorismate mutase [[Bacillus] enclensis]